MYVYVRCYLFNAWLNTTDVSYPPILSWIQSSIRSRIWNFIWMNLIKYRMFSALTMRKVWNPRSQTLSSNKYIIYVYSCIYIYIYMNENHEKYGSRWLQVWLQLKTAMVAGKGLVRVWWNVLRSFSLHLSFIRVALRVFLNEITWLLSKRQDSQ